jgi:hypothetical protein
MSRPFQLDVPLQMSSFSSSITRRPRDAASRAIPAPFAPAPMTITSNGSSWCCPRPRPALSTPSIKRSPAVDPAREVPPAHRRRVDDLVGSRTRP